MLDTLFFAGFDPLHETPKVCTLCSSRPPVFQFDYRMLGKEGECQESKGFCCAACAADLLKKLETAESREWAEEEAALQADDLDVSEFHRNRLAAFPRS
jgi:hypothetical protein